jgi:hypothetical protein
MTIRAECDKQEKVITVLKERKMELEDDRRFLDLEIRDCRLQNQNLKVTISKTHNKCDELQATKEELENQYAAELSQNNAVSARPGSFVSGYRSSVGQPANQTKPLDIS